MSNLLRCPHPRCLVQFILNFWFSINASPRHNPFKFSLGGFCSRLAVYFKHFYTPKRVCIENLYFRCRPVLFVFRPLLIQNQSAQLDRQLFLKSISPCKLHDSKQCFGFGCKRSDNRFFFGRYSVSSRSFLHRRRVLNNNFCLRAVFILKTTVPPIYYISPDKNFTGQLSAHQNVSTISFSSAIRRIFNMA